MEHLRVPARQPYLFGLVVNFLYNGSINAPTDVGSYTVIGTVNDANYQGSATNTFVIRERGSFFSFLTTGSLTSARGLHTATLLPNGKVLVAGGWNGSTHFASSELY